MTYLLPGDYIVRCPDCNRIIKNPPLDGKKQCRKCLQYVIFESGEPIRAIPKDLT